MEEECLDFVLVPLGLILLGIYHAWLLITIRLNPRKTVIGLNAESRHQWVFAMMAVSTFFLYALYVFDDCLAENFQVLWVLICVQN